jgi:hypothetical protein
MEWTARSHGLIYGAAGMLAVLATVLFAMLRPPMLTSTASVMVLGRHAIETQALIAGSDPVLQGAVRRDPGSSLAQPTDHVQAVPVSQILLIITASAITAADAEGAANAVARSYVAFSKSPHGPAGGGQVRALVLDQAFLRHGLVCRRGWQRPRVSACWWVPCWA